eukprot:gene3792-biopygen12230
MSKTSPSCRGSADSREEVAPCRRLACPPSGTSLGRQHEVAAHSPANRDKKDKLAPSVQIPLKPSMMLEYSPVWTRHLMRSKGVTIVCGIPERIPPITHNIKYCPEWMAGDRPPQFQYTLQ